MIKNRITDEYRRSAKKYNDAPTSVDMVQSVKEMRAIYSNLTDLEFISMYAQRYHFRPDDVAEFLDRIRKQEKNSREMNEMKKYTDVIRYGHKTTQGIFNPGDPIIVQEKLDGANASFKRVGDEIQAFSRNTPLNEENNLRGFYQWTQSLNVYRLHEDAIYFGEWVVKHKIDYGENLNKFYLYDVYSPVVQEYVEFDVVVNEARRLHVNLIPVFYVGPFISFEHLQSFVGKSEAAPEGVEGEGITVKNHGYKDRYGNQLFVKLVTDAFREIQSQKAPKDPNLKSHEQVIIETVVTKARVEKIIHKLVDEGVLDEHFGIKDMGTILKHLGTRVYEDIVKEEYDVIKEFEEKDVRRFIGKIVPKVSRDVILGRQKENADPQ